MNKILCVHQSSELYGSDRVFLDSIRAIRNAYPKAEIEIILPDYGPLVPLLEEHRVTFKYGPIVKVQSSDIKDIFRIAKLILKLGCVIETIRRVKKFDCVYINTIVPINFFLAACLYRPFGKTKFISHPHEMVSSRIGGYLIGSLISLSSHRVICNSATTAKSFYLEKKKKTSIVWNGTNIPNISDHVSDERSEIRILMPGRLSSRKGQELLIQSCIYLDMEEMNIKIRILGDTASGQEHIKKHLQRLVLEAKLDSRISFDGFQEDMEPQYNWADLVVVPSTKPESFGMVAIEAMSYAKPIIAANLGGLKEIVTHADTGWLFDPGNARALASTIIAACSDKRKIKECGLRSRERVKQLFSLTSYENNFSYNFGKV